MLKIGVIVVCDHSVIFNFILFNFARELLTVGSWANFVEMLVISMKLPIEYEVSFVTLVT